jgi:hypothetical protein
MVIATRYWRLRKEHQRLAVQSGKSHYGPQTSAAIGIERDNLVLGDAVEMAIRPKAQTARPGKLGQAAGREDAHKMSVRGVVFANGRRGIRRAERVLARYDDIAVGCDRQIKRAEFRVADQPDRPHELTGVKRNDSVVAYAIGVDPGGEKKSSAVTERKSAWKRHDRRWEEILAGGVKCWGKRHNGAPASRADEITTVRPEISTTGVQSFHLAGVAHHDPIGTERQHAIAAAVEKQQPFARIDGETGSAMRLSSLNAPRDLPSPAIKGEKRAVSVAVSSRLRW